MSVCKFYIQGNCKYGSRCRFEHAEYGAHSSRSGDLSGGERHIGVSILKGGNSSFSTYHNYQQSPNQSSTVQFSQPSDTHSFPQRNTTGPVGLFNVQEVMSTISRDAAQAAKGSQWRLSCYSPSRDLPNVPGLEDCSPEEMRWECYKALFNGTLHIWQAMAQQLVNNVNKTYSDLQQKDHLYALVDGWLRRNVSLNSPAQNATAPIQGSAAAASPFFNHPPSYPVQPSGSDFSFSLSASQVGTPQIQPNFSTGANLFGNKTHSPSPVSNPFGTEVSASCSDSQAYSNPEDLSEDDCKAFQADRFTMGKIPTKPPTVSFCN